MINKMKLKLVSLFSVLIGFLVGTFTNQHDVAADKSTQYLAFKKEVKKPILLTATDEPATVENDAPAPTKTEYGAPTPTATEYGAPTPTTTEYGAPTPTKTEYGAPGKKLQQKKVIIQTH